MTGDAEVSRERIKPHVYEDGLLVSYTGRGGRQRLVVVGVNDNGVWVVYDIGKDAPRTRRGLLVEHLLGWEEKVGKAQALALSYAECQIAFVRGEREDQLVPNPLPKPVRVPMRLIDRHVRAAINAIAHEQEIPSDAAWFERVMRLAERQNALAMAEPPTLAA